jgi:hypothetical protein
MIVYQVAQPRQWITSLQQGVAETKKPKRYAPAFDSRNSTY